MYRVTKHVIDRYREFYTDAEADEVVEAAEESEEVEQNISMRLRGYDYIHEDHSGRHRLHPERTGLFVVNEEGDTLVTFIRFYSRQQHELARKLYGPGREPKANATWVDKPLLSGQTQRVSRYPNGIMSNQVEIRCDGVDPSIEDLFPIAMWKHEGLELDDFGVSISRGVKLVPVSITELAEETYGFFQTVANEAFIDVIRGPNTSPQN